MTDIETALSADEKERQGDPLNTLLRFPDGPHDMVATGEEMIQQIKDGHIRGMYIAVVYNDNSTGYVYRGLLTNLEVMGLLETAKSVEHERQGR